MRAPVYSDVMICNLALAEVPDKPIALMTEASLQARECVRAYAQCFGEMLEDEPWLFAVTREALAEITNDRDHEWRHAYKLPANCAFMGKVFRGHGHGPDLTASPHVHRHRDFEQISDWNDRAPGWSFVYGKQGSVLYTDCPFAVLEYTLSEIEEAVLTPKFVRGLACLIASRIVTPLTKDRSKSKDIVTLAEFEIGRAKAFNRNKQEDRYGDFVPDWIAAR